MDIAIQLAVEHKVYSPSYHQQSIRRIEEFHNFIKSCMTKHVLNSLEFPLACAAYIFLSNGNPKESPFFLMFV